MITIVEPSWSWAPLTLKMFPDILEHIEWCGRTCYKSEDRIAPGTAEKFVRMICKRNHVSVLEHVSLTARVVCSRACSHQLVRHRLAAYSQESMRYCNYGKRGLQVICPPLVGLEPGEYAGLTGSVLQRRWLQSVQEAYNEYLWELEMGVKPEDARFMLPNATKTEVVATYNLRTWQHVLAIRTDPHAQWEIRGIMQSILDDLQKRLPSVFGDINES